MLGPDVVVAHPQGLPEREFQRLSRLCVERDERRHLVERGGSVAVAVCRTVSSGTPCATIAFAASASGSLSSPSTRCSGRISSLPAARASFCAAITTFLARSVNRLNPWLGSRSDGSPGSFGTKRFWAACLVTPMLLPMSVQDAPERRAWSTKWPIRWSATSPR